ncbi:MAG: hypothetical protein HW418_2140 [Anaerolineales bacterium]|nr:hypothetical protein [Anaerolineales bacterium]
MPSPFPGMDPYLENPATWSDLHQSLITYIRDALQPELRPNYLARIGERVYVAETGRNIYPDVTLLGRPMREPRPTGPAPAAEAEASPVAVREPFTLMLPSGEHREPYLEIIHSTGREVVTVIEVLSPANKTPGVGYEQYRKKQSEVLRSRAHLVEIDLLSQGVFALAFSDEDKRPDDVPRSRYLISVSRAPDRTVFDLYPLILPEPLPTFRIPLRAPDPDVLLNLQAVFNKCYENGRYAEVMDYTQPPPAPLSLDEQHWVKTNLFKTEK